MESFNISVETYITNMYCGKLVEFSLECVSPLQDKPDKWLIN